MLPSSRGPSLLGISPYPTIKVRPGARQGRSICWELSGFYPIRRGREASRKRSSLLQISSGQANLPANCQSRCNTRRNETRSAWLFCFLAFIGLHCRDGLGYRSRDDWLHYMPRQDPRLSERPRNRAIYPLLQASSSHQRMDDMALLSIIYARSCSIVFFRESVLS